MIRGDKLNFFTQVIYEGIDEEIKKAEMLFQQEKSQKLEEFNKYSEDRSISEIAETEEKFNFKIMELVTKTRHRSKQEVLRFKESLIDNTIASLKNKFEEFTESEGYKKFFLDLINKTIQFVDGQPAIIYITEKDFDRFGSKVNKLLKGLDIAVVLINKSIIGGIIIEDKDKSFRIDNSILSVIEENRDYISLMLMEALEQEVTLFDE